MKLEVSFGGYQNQMKRFVLIMTHGGQLREIWQEIFSQSKFSDKIKAKSPTLTLIFINSTKLPKKKNMPSFKQQIMVK